MTPPLGLQARGETHFITCLPAVFAAIVTTVTVFVIVTAAELMAVMGAVSRWAPNQSHCSGRPYSDLNGYHLVGKGIRIPITGPTREF
jgi:hypothetical protein